MKMMKQELMGAKLAEVRIMYVTGTEAEDVILAELNAALDRIRDAGIQIEGYTEEDKTRFNSMV